MAIAALPESTRHLLNSAQVLTTPTSLVKELIDNALDAKATSVDISISPNTLDKLEVRDNGNGIQQEDLDALGRRGHTSKLRSFEELIFLGGITLGFRGEALASAVQLGEVSVTTKTDGESVATSVRLKASGGVDKQSRTSHPVGTTVIVSNFMAKLPVRKKTFEKEATKTLHKINYILQAYALARPFIRFSLKVTKGAKESWSFAPRPNDGIREAVSLVIGRDAALQCIERSLEFSEDRSSKYGGSQKDHANVGDPSETSNDKSRECFKVDAFLPKPDADFSKIGHGQYLSIDSRPVSHEKGTMKKIVTIFKKYIRGSISDTSEKLKSPFIRLHIKCPTASYDANVEPAKDDVLFGNESLILQSVEKLFKHVYGEQAVATMPPQRSPAKEFDIFEVLLAQKPQSASKNNTPPLLLSRRASASPSESSSLPQAPNNESPEGSVCLEAEESLGQHLGSKRRDWGVDMSNDYSEEVEGYERRRPNKYVNPYMNEHNDDEIPSESRASLNPWVVAKMNAPNTRDSGPSTDRNEKRWYTEPRTSAEISQPQSFSESPPKQAARPRQTFRNNDIMVIQPSVAKTSHSAIRGIHQTPLPLNRPPIQGEVGHEILMVDDDRSRRTECRNDFVTARDIPNSLPMSPPPTQLSKPKKSRGSNQPFVPPLRPAENRVSPDGLVQSRLSIGYKPPVHNSSSHSTESPGSNDDLAWAMDFEYRKEEATQRRRDELRIAKAAQTQFEFADVIRSSPHKNRYNAAIASLEGGKASSRNDTTNVKEPYKSTLPDDDPRAYLMRRQKSLTAHSVPGIQPKLTRAKSMKLPLEKITSEGQIHQLVQQFPVDLSNLRRFAASLLKDDLYVSHGNQTSGLAMNSSDISVVKIKLVEVVKSWMGDREERISDIDYTFGIASSTAPILVE